MDKYLYRSLNSYYNKLFNTGKVSQEQTNKLLVLSFISDMINNDFRGYLTKEDYNTIIQSLYCIYGSDCLFPYPEYNYKSNRTMYNGSISELVYRVNTLENNQEEIKNTDVIVPGEEVSETE